MLGISRYPRLASGQSKLKRCRVFCVGAGGLGSPALLYLAAAGIGHLTVIDDDVIERSNLQRQIMHADDDVGISKAESAMLRLRELNPSISIQVYAERLTAENAMNRVQGHDIVLDGTDNIPTRYLINDVCELLGIPWVYGSIYRFEGQVSVFNLDEGPTYRDLFPTLHHLKLYPHVRMEGYSECYLVSSVLFRQLK